MRTIPFQRRPRRKLKVVVKGLLQSPIQYEVRSTTGDWTSFLPTFQPQKWGNYDSDSCWCLSTITSLEIQLDWLWTNNMFSPEAKTFLAQYLDVNGKFSISERYLEVLGGNYENGGTAEEAIQLMQSYGAVPRALLTYSEAQANACATEEAFTADYFNVNIATPALRAMGHKFLTYVNIAYQRIGYMYQTPNQTIFQAALKQSPLSLGIPADLPQWNNSYVQWDGVKAMTHEVCCFGGQYNIFDQYHPNPKTLSPDFYIGGCIQLIASAIAPASVNPIPQPPIQTITFWSWIMRWFNGIFGSPIPIGSSSISP